MRNRTRADADAASGRDLSGLADAETKSKVAPKSPPRSLEEKRPSTAAAAETKSAASSPSLAALARVSSEDISSPASPVHEVVSDKQLEAGVSTPSPRATPVAGASQEVRSVEMTVMSSASEALKPQRSAGNLPSASLGELWIGMVGEEATRDPDSKVDAEMLQSVLAEFGEDPAHAEWIVVQADANGDGFLDFKEFEAFFGNIFAQRQATLEGPPS